ncbi:MAG: hypothetical protein LC722_07490 [Actinobacteria bacterium]|nr:hypothetical protein [Actinomycetota bacterium]
MRSPVSLARLASVCAALALVACGPGGDAPTPGPTLTLGPVPAVLSTDLATGRNRFVFTLLDGRTGRSMAAPDVSVDVAFFELPDRIPVAEAEGAFAWIEPGRAGAYVAEVELRAGSWEAEVSPDGARPSRVGFLVRERSLSPAVGQKAPASFTRTLRDVQGRLEELTTDPAPLARFYRTSILQAEMAAIPFVVIFASPGHCSGTGCANMLRIAKRVAAGTTDLTFIHVEPYRDAREAMPSHLDPAFGEWGLTSDPWLFVVGAHGRVVAKFERVVTVQELRAAIERLY